MGTTEHADDTGAERNRILLSLPADERGRLLRDMETVELPNGRVLYEQDAPIAHVYFPQTGVISMVTVMEDGDVVEIATIGNEGLAGFPVFLGAGSVPHKAFAQVPGRARRLPADAFRRAAAESPGLRAVVQRYIQALFNQVGQSAACNRLHTVEERLARWLLLSQDRVGGDLLPLTQHFLAEMLGVRRAGVTVAAGALQRAGIIHYRRGKITVLDRAALEAASCECYRMVREHDDRLLGSGRDALRT